MRFPFARFKISGNSMLPSLRPGREILVFTWYKNPKIGDIVVLRKNDKDLIKRVSSVNGDLIEVKGDNINVSTDSRNFGPIRKSEVLGKMIL